jgi:hypothetical protein
MARTACFEIYLGGEIELIALLDVERRNTAS